MRPQPAPLGAGRAFERVVLDLARAHVDAIETMQRTGEGLVVKPVGALVRYVLGREEEMQFGSPRGAERIYVKDGVMWDGRLVARRIRERMRTVLLGGTPTPGDAALLAILQGLDVAPKVLEDEKDDAMQAVADALRAIPRSAAFFATMPAARSQKASCDSPNVARSSSGRTRRCRCRVAS